MLVIYNLADKVVSMIIGVAPQSDSESIPESMVFGLDLVGDLPEGVGKAYISDAGTMRAVWDIWEAAQREDAVCEAVSDDEGRLIGIRRKTEPEGPAEGEGSEVSDGDVE